MASVAAGEHEAVLPVARLPWTLYIRAVGQRLVTKYSSILLIAPIPAPDATQGYQAHDTHDSPNDRLPGRCLRLSQQKLGVVSEPLGHTAFDERSY